MRPSDGIIKISGRPIQVLWDILGVIDGTDEVNSKLDTLDDKSDWHRNLFATEHGLPVFNLVDNDIVDNMSKIGDLFILQRL